jgi:hypothetical protein
VKKFLFIVILISILDVLKAQVETTVKVGAYSCDFGHPVLTKADTQSRSKRTLVPEDSGHLIQHSFSHLFFT